MPDIAAPPASIATIPTPSPTPTPAPPKPAPTPSSATPAIALPPEAAKPPAKGTARARLHEELEKISKPANGAVDANAQKTDAAKPAVEPDKTGAAPGAEPPKDGKQEKARPWELVKQYKGQVAQLEKELADAKTSTVPENDRKGFEERIRKAEARAAELEQHMRFVDYSKTEDFQNKYVQPYEKAWSNAVSELKEITITDPGGTERPVTPQDILDLVNLPLGKAREIADTAFGKFADDVMSHRKQIRSLFEAQQTALEEAKKSGGETLTKQQQEAQANFQKLQSTVKDIWQKENAAMIADKTYGPLFSKREGDAEWNTRLENGFALVDRAFSETPNDPKLTPEQRQAVIRRHAAIRNRAAAWGALKGENDSLKAQVETLTKELGQYKSSEPGMNGGRLTPNANGSNGHLSARERMHQELRSRAK